MNDRPRYRGAPRRLGIAALSVIALAEGAWADEAREKQLEERVQQLEQTLSRVEEGMRGGYFSASSDLEARVGELERLVADEKGGMVSYFKNGMKSESTDGMHKFNVYGRIQNDWSWFDVDEEVEAATGTEINGGTEFRRVRLGAEGQLYGNVKFKSEIDFAHGEGEFADVFMELANLPWGNLRVGHFDEPFGLDRLTSSRFSVFLERNAIAEAFAPQRNTGVMFWGQAMEEQLLWQAGMFRDADVFGDDINNTDVGEYNFTARLSGRPIVKDDGNTYLHLGAAVSYRDFSNDTARFRARPNVHMSPRLVDTGTIAPVLDGAGNVLTEGAETGMLFGLEAAFNTGPFCAAFEYCLVDVDSEVADDPTYDSWSIEASYWLTGDTRTYSKTKGAFDRPKIKKNYGDEEGTGGWQVGLRWDTIDLNDGDPAFHGGEMDTLTAGVNWWLNPNTRIGFNWVHADPSYDDGTEEGEMDAFVVRFQVDF